MKLLEQVMEAACEICRWPFECEDEAQLCEKCESCPVQAALQDDA